MIDGKPRQLFQLGLDGHFVLIASDPILEELDKVLQRPMFAHTRSEIVQALQTLKALSRRFPAKSSLRVIDAGPDDNIFINAAMDGRAKYVVTGDHQLLEL